MTYPPVTPIIQPRLTQQHHPSTQAVLCTRHHLTNIFRLKVRNCLATGPRPILLPPADGTIYCNQSGGNAGLPWPRVQPWHHTSHRSPNSTTCPLSRAARTAECTYFCMCRLASLPEGCHEGPWPYPLEGPVLKCSRYLPAFTFNDQHPENGPRPIESNTASRPVAQASQRPQLLQPRVTQFCRQVGCQHEFTRLG